MDEYNDATDLELNESEVDEILGLEREIGEPVDELGEEEFTEGVEGEEPEKEEPEPAPASMRKNAKKKEKRKAKAASGAVEEVEEAIPEEQGEDKRDGTKGAFQRIPFGEIPQIRNAIEIPLPKVDSFDVDGNLFVGGRILASSKEVFSSYQTAGMERAQSEWETPVMKSRKLESRELGSRESESKESEHKEQEQGISGRIEAKSENYASMGTEDVSSNGSAVNAIGSVPGYFGMAAPVVERALASPKSKLHISVSDGAIEHSVRGGMPGIAGTGRIYFGSMGNTGEFQGNIGNFGQIGVQSYGNNEAVLGNGSQPIADKKEIQREPVQVKERELQRTYQHDLEQEYFWKSAKEMCENDAENTIERNVDGGNAINTAADTQNNLMPIEAQRQILESKHHEKQSGLRTLEGLGTISEQGGRLVFRFVSGDVRDEGTAERQGKEVLIRRTAFAAATMDTVAAVSARYTYLEHLKRFQKGGEEIHKLVSGETMDVSELLKPGRELRGKLQEMGVERSVIRDIVRNRKGIFETFQDVQDVRKAVESGRIGLKKEEQDIFKSKKVFNRIRYGKQTNAVLRRLLRASDHEILRKTRFTRKTVRIILRRAERYQLSKSEVRLLRKWLRNDRDTAFLRFTSRGFGAYGRILRNKVNEQDDAVTAGRKKIGQIAFSVKATAVAFYKTGRWTMRTAGFVGGTVSYGLAEGVTRTARKVTGDPALDFHLIRRGKVQVQKKAAEIRKSAGEKAEQVRQEMKKVKGKAVRKVRESKPGKTVTAFRNQTKETIKKVNEKFHHSRAGHFVKKTGSVAKKVGRVVKKPVKAVAKGAKITAKVVFKPFQIAGNLWVGIRKAVAVVVKYVLIAVLAVSAIYVLLIYLNGAMDSAIEAIKAWVEDSEENIICVEDGKTVQEWAAMLSVKDAELYKKAKELGEGTPKNPEVLHGKQIKHYGHSASGEQAASAGYMIHYIDVYGNPVANSTTNIKDVIALSCVMFGQEMEKDQASREVFRELLADMYDLMNLELTYEESEIYTCAGSGCDSYSYFCNSDDDYKEMDTMKAEGVGFYGTIQTQSGGCYCPGHTSTWHHAKGDTSCPDIDGADDSCGGHEETTYDDGCQCRGHSISVCYGHKDVDIYIKVISKEYVFAENLLPSGWESKSYAGYIREFVSNGSWSNKELSEWATHLCQQDWYSLYGFTVGNNYGFIVEGSVPHYAGGIFCFPLADYVRVFSDYGWRIHPISGERKVHSGIDFAAVSGTAIYAAERGIVTVDGSYVSPWQYITGE